MANERSGSARAGDCLAEKVDHLFLTVRRPDGREYTYDEVESGTGGRVSRSYVWKLRKGRNRNPSLEVVEALAGFFGVPAGYFFGGALADDGESRLAAAVAALLRDDAARALLEGSRGLSPAAMSALLAMLGHLRGLDGAKGS
jgi:transcriptional regulator with XRE-family HTH domain